MIDDTVARRGPRCDSRSAILLHFRRPSAVSARGTGASNRFSFVSVCRQVSFANHTERQDMPRILFSLLFIGLLTACAGQEEPLGGYPGQSGNYGD